LVGGGGVGYTLTPGIVYGDKKMEAPEEN